MRRASTLVIGGGPAGSIAATQLAKGGAKPLLLERHNEPHDALCGGFLSWRTLAILDDLDFDTGRLGGQRIGRVAIYAGEKRVEAKLPKSGVGVSRHRLDGLLLDHASRAGAAIECGQSVRKASLPPKVRLASGGDIAANALFLATGKHDLRGLKRPVGDSNGDGWMGLRFRLNASTQLRTSISGTIELHLFKGGYAGLLLQEDGSVNLCMALRRSRLADADGKPLGLLDRLCAEAPSIAERIDGEETPDHGDAIGMVPYGWRATNGEAGLFRLGDQAAVIPSLAGEGVGIAIASGRAAAAAYLKSGPEAAVDYQRQFSKRAKRPLAIADMLKKFSENPAQANVALGLAKIPGIVALASRMTRIA